MSNKYNLSYKLFGLTILVLSIIRLISYHWEVITNIYPNEYREGAMLMTTKLLLSGGNPYDPDLQPQYTNVYGILYPLVTAALAFFTKVDLPTHRLVSAIFILASCSIIYLIMLRSNVTLFYRIGGVGIFYGHSIYSCSYAYPNGLGVFLLLLTVFIPWRYNYQRNSLIVSILAGILGFLVKPYFVLGVFYLATYLFFTDRSKAIKYSFAAIISFAVVMAWMNWQFPVYINNCLLGHANIAGNSIPYMLQQLQTYALDNIWLIILGVIVSWNQRSTIFNTKIKSIGLINTCLIVSLLLFVTKLGLHEGAWISYLHHLVSPFAIVSLFTVFSRQSTVLVDRKKYNVVSYMLIIFAMIQLRSSMFLPDILPESYQNWVAIDKIITSHKQVLSTPIVASILLGQNKPVWDNGESEYFIYGVKHDNYLKFKQHYEQYRQKIKDRLAGKEFDLVITNNKMNSDAFIDLRTLSEFYNKDKNLQLLFPFGKKTWRGWDVSLYTPKK